MSDAPTLQLPALQQTELDDATLAQLFSDLAGCTEVLGVLPRAAVRTFVPAQNVSLEAAHTGLGTGAFRGVQIRYRYSGREWNDTLLSVAPGRTRLVRICADDIQASLQAGA